MAAAGAAAWLTDCRCMCATGVQAECDIPIGVGMGCEERGGAELG